jgi:L-arabinose isomerase
MTTILSIGDNKDSVCMLIQRLTRQGFDIGWGEYDAKPIAFERPLEKTGALTSGRSLP